MERGIQVSTSGLGKGHKLSWRNVTEILQESRYCRGRFLKNARDVRTP